MPVNLPYEPYPSPEDASYGDVVRRVEARGTYDEEALKAQAVEQLEGVFGSGPPPTVVAVPVGLGILSAHTHYFSGFGLVLPMPCGVVVAMRSAKGRSVRAVTSPGGPGVSLLELGDEGRILEGLTVRAMTEAGRVSGLEIAIVHPKCFACPVAEQVAMGTATVRALTQVLALEWSEAIQIEHVRVVLEALLNRPFGKALPLAAFYGRLGALSLLDTATGEHLPLDLPDGDRLAWGVISGGAGTPPNPQFFSRRQAEYARALLQLQRRFNTMYSARDLEHRDLPRALNLIHKSLRPVLRHLVSENRRVSQMVTAVRRPNVHLLGGLLLISQASLRNDWGVEDDWMDTIVAAGQGAEGVYGARSVDEGGSRCVLVVGQPIAVAAFLNRMERVLEQHYGTRPETMLF